MADPAIRVEDLGKRYRIGAGRPLRRNFREALAEGLAGTLRAGARRLGLARGGPPPAPESAIWALRGVSFAVEPGETVGIIGRNGSGKTTLLKVLSRITDPTTGRVWLNGRVASLLEVGAGFHPELTGRENIFLNGAILGMTAAEIRRKFDEIVAFAEIEKFMDTPVKRYSSGMYMRLAFAVAAHLEPEILLVDEVLAVGDFGFQRKCLGKMKDVASAGRTVLFVSHNMSAVQNLCAKAALLDNGRVRYFGSSSETVAAYLEGFAQGPESAGRGLFFRASSGAPADSCAILWMALTDAEGRLLETLHTWDRVRFCVAVRSRTKVELAAVEMVVRTLYGEILLRYSSRPCQTVDFSLEPDRVAVVCCEFPRLPLSAGRYLVDLQVQVPMVGNLCSRPGYCAIDVVESDVFRSGYAFHAERCPVLVEHQWSVLDAAETQAFEQRLGKAAL